MFQRRRKMARLERGLMRNRRAPVPGTNVLANVAAEHMLADGGAQLLRRGCVQFNSEVRDAAAGVDFVAFRRNGLRGTSVDAAGASSAAVGGRSGILIRLIGFDLERCQDLA